MEYRSRRLLTARLCRESGLKGVHQKRATGWRTLSPTPAGSGKSARPVPGRTRDTDHRQRLCRAASAGAVKRGARRHPLSERNGRFPARLRHTSSAIMRHIVDYPRRSGDFRQLIVICRGRPFQFPTAHQRALRAHTTASHRNCSPVRRTSAPACSRNGGLILQQRRFPADTTACRNQPE